MDNNNFNNSNGYYQGPNTYYQPVQNSDEQKKGMAIWSLVLGILALTLCCLIGWLPGAIGLVLGIVSLAKGRGGKGMAIAGIVTSAIGFILGVYMTVMLVLGGIFAAALDSAAEGDDFYKAIMKQAAEDYYDEYGRYPDYYYEYFGDEDEDDDNNKHSIITEPDSEDGGSAVNQKWCDSMEAADGSTIHFYKDGTFKWYRDEATSGDVYLGTYEVLFGKEAKDYIVNDLAEYGVTEEELDEFHKRNEGSDVYNEDCLTLMIIHKEKSIIDGEESITQMDAYYSGYFDGNFFDSANMASRNKAYFTRIE